MVEPERSALIGPRERNPAEQELDRQGPGLAAFDDRLDNVGGKESKAQEPSNMCVAQTEALGDLRGVCIFALSQGAQPRSRARDRQDQSLIDTTSGRSAASWDDDFLAGAGTGVGKADFEN